MRAGLWVAVCLGLAGCLGGTEAPEIDTPANDSPSPVEFSVPSLLTAEIGGFEPSIRAGPEGNLYAAAAKTNRPNADDRLADWLWYSSDDGATWHDLPLGPSDAGRAMPGLEGDLAVDARGRVYFADTHLADYSLHRWSVGPDRTPVWDFSRPITPTADVLDDRPYMAAHGDGVVYLLSNNGVAPPAPQNLLRDPTALGGHGARIWIFTSQDAGLTWSPGWGFPGEVFCAPAAARTDDVTVTVTCYRGAGPGSPLTIYRSTDRGASFQMAWSTNHTRGPGYLTPWPATDAAGWAYAAWLDDLVDWSGLQDVEWGGDLPGYVMFARSRDGIEWERFDLTPLVGRFGMSHVSSGPGGHVAVTFHATHDLAPGADTQWFGFALITRDACAPEPVWELVQLAPEPTATGPIPPRDFFQNAVGPDGRTHVTLQRNRDLSPGEEGNPGRGIPADVLYLGEKVAPPTSVA